VESCSAGELTQNDSCEVLYTNYKCSEHQMEIKICCGCGKGNQITLKLYVSITRKCIIEVYLTHLFEGKYDSY
jgi:hypothetical protein